MGACTSKQEGGASSSGKVKFEKIGAASLDKIFQEAQQVNDNFTKPLGAIMKNKELFLKLSKFELEPSKKLGGGVVGMLLFFGSSVEDPSKLNFKT